MSNSLASLCSSIGSWNLSSIIILLFVNQNLEVTHHKRQIQCLLDSRFSWIKNLVLQNINLDVKIINNDDEDKHSFFSKGEALINLDLEGQVLFICEPSEEVLN